MSEANETNDKLAKIKEQIMIATHETGEMPKIWKSKKKADSNGGYFYDAQSNTLYLKDEQTWNAIKDNLSADLSSDDMGINVSIQPLQGIDGYQGESIEDLQDKVDKVNRENHHEYYRLIKRGDYDFLLCYSFNNVADRDRFAAEMDDAFGVGNGDVSEGAKFDKYDDEDEDIDEDFSDEEVLDAPSHRKQNDNRKQKDTQKEKAKVNKKKQKDDKKKKNDDDITKDNEEGEQEVTLVEELGDTQVNQTGGTQVNDNSASGNAGGSGKTEQAIEARLAAVNNGQPLPNRYAYLEQYCRIAKEFGEPDGYSLSKDMGKRKAFEVGNVNGRPHHCKEKKLQEMSRENLLMHMLSDILPAITGGEVVHYRDDGVNKLYIGSPTTLVNFDSVLNHDSVRNSVFFGYFRSLIECFKPLASKMKLTRNQTAIYVINLVINDIRLMDDYLNGGRGTQWVDNLGEEPELRNYLKNGMERNISEVIMPYCWMRGVDFKPFLNDSNQLVFKFTPRTVRFSDHGLNQYSESRVMRDPVAEDLVPATRIAFDCGDAFPSGDIRKDMYYCAWAEVVRASESTDVAADHNGVNFNTYGRGGEKSWLGEALKRERQEKGRQRSLEAVYFTPSLKESNLRKLFTGAEMAKLESFQELPVGMGNEYTPPIIMNYDRELQNLNSGYDRGAQYL